MASILVLTCGHPDGSLAQLTALPDAGRYVQLIDEYELDDVRLDAHMALLISMHVDQRLLATHRVRLDRYVQDGGTIVANGHVAYDFLEGLSPFRPIENYRLADLMVNREAPHPVWAGVSPEELSLRRGVAGFYGRGWHRPPEGAQIHHSLGPDRRPLDFTYHLGHGRVLFHGGNDLWQNMSGNDSTSRIAPQLLRWILTPEHALQ